jgi:hypothetical protein
MGSRAAFFASWLPKKISRSRIFIECAGLQASRGQGLVGRPAKNLFNGSGFLIVVNLIDVLLTRPGPTNVRKCAA